MKGEDIDEVQSLVGVIVIGLSLGDICKSIAQPHLMKEFFEGDFFVRFAFGVWVKITTCSVVLFC